MNKMIIISFVLISVFFSSADTFTHKRTGRVFHGYPTQRTRNGETLIRTGKNFNAKYIDLSEYDIEQNHEGRRDKVVIITLDHEIAYECAVKAIESALEVESNQGPEFILLEIDTPGGKVDLAERICNALSKADNCRIVAFVKGGAISAGAIVTLACDEIYMNQGSTIGGATSFVFHEGGPKSLKEAYGETIGEKIKSIWIAFCESVAEKNNRPAKIVRAMIDKDIKVIEVEEGQTRSFILPEERAAEQKVIKTWSDKGTLLTLTAEEAVECGIADAIVQSREDLISKLATDDVRPVVNMSHKKVIQVYSEIEESLERIGQLRKVYNSLISEIEEIDQKIADTEKVNYRYYDSGRHEGYVVENEYASGARAVRQGKMHQLRGVLRDLIKEYKSAIYKGQRVRELTDEIAELRQGLKSAEKAYKKLTR